MIFEYLSNYSVYADTTNFDDDGSAPTSSCAELLRTEVAYGIDTAALSFQAASLVANGLDLPGAKRIMLRLSFEKIGPAGTPVCGFGKNYSYNGYYSQNSSHCFLIPLVAFSAKNYDAVTQETVNFPVLDPALNPTILQGLAAMHVDGFTQDVSTSAAVFEKIVPILNAMQVGNLFAESPEVLVSIRDEVRKELGNATAEPGPFVPGPTAVAASVSKSLTITNHSVSRSINAPFFPGPNASISRTVEIPPASTIAPTTEHPTTLAPETTSDPATPHPSTATPPTTQEPTQSTLHPTTSVVETTTSHPTESPPLPSTAVPPTAAPQTPEVSTMPPTLAPSTLQPPAPPVPFRYKALISSQILLLAWTGKLVALGSSWEGRVSLPVLSAAARIYSVVNTSLTETICHCGTLVGPDPYLPLSIDLTDGTVNITIDALTQVIALAAVGHFLSVDCYDKDKTIGILNSTIKSFGIWSGPDLVGISTELHGDQPDAVATAVLLMACKRLWQETSDPQTARYLVGLMNSLSSDASSLRASSCVIGGTGAFGAAFEANVPSSACGGPLLSIEASAVTYLAFAQVNFFDPPVHPLTGTPFPIPPQDASAPSGINVVVGCSVGVVVVIVAGALVWSKFRRPRDDLLLQEPTENIGFY